MQHYFIHSVTSGNLRSGISSRIMTEPAKYPPNNVREFRKALGLSLEALAGMIEPSVTLDAVKKIEKSERELTHTWMLKLAIPLRCEPEDLIRNAKSRIVNVPILGKVSAGRWIENIRVHTDKVIPYRYSKPTLVALQVEGNSMNRFAPDGSYIVVDYSINETRDGAKVIARHGNHRTFKVYRSATKSAPERLEPFSTEQHETLYPSEDCQILGHVIGAIN